jgi:GAF domain-containing protein
VTQLSTGSEIQTLRAENAALRAENAALRAAAETQTHENLLMLRMISDVVSSLDLDRVLRHIVEHLVAAVGCHGGFVYLADPRRQRLTLRAASRPYQHTVGQISLAFGEGLAGWAAVTGKPVMVREHAMDDPRFRYFPELDEETFQAMLVVPLTGGDGATVAVVSMHTIAPQEFTDDHVRLVEAVAPVLGSAIRATTVVEDAGRRLRMLSSLSDLVQTVRAGRYRDDVLRTLTEKLLTVVQSDACALVVAEPGLDDLLVYSYRRDEDAYQAARGAIERRPWDQLTTSLTPPRPGLVPALALPGMAASGMCCTAPLIAAGEQVGLLVAHRLLRQPYSDDDRALLTVIAGQIALAIKNSQIADLLAERDLPARLFRDLLDGAKGDLTGMVRRAAMLGCDLTRPHLPLVIDLSVPPAGTAAETRAAADQRDLARQQVARALRHALSERYPGSLVHAEQAIYSIMPLDDSGEVDALCGYLDQLCATLLAELALPLIAGAGSLCPGPRDYRRGFAEATEAVQVGRALHRQGVVRFDALGAARYLARIPVEVLGSVDHTEEGGSPRDRYQAGVARLAAHDSRKHTALLQTLETYLRSGGNMARAAEQLYVHRNTLIQRLTRIRELLGFDPLEPDAWLALHLAIELHRLHPE